MNLRAMVFIDGSWLYHNRQHIAHQVEGEDFEIDYRKVPVVVAHHLKELTHADIDVVRTCYFGSIAANKPGYNPSKQQAFYDFLAAQCFFETEIYEIDFRNDPNARPREKCTDLALAAAMMYYAAVPNALDICALVGGDLDYLPLLQRVRMLGKRTMLVAIRGAAELPGAARGLLADPSLFDFPPVYLEDHLDKIKLVREEILRDCAKCGKKEFTTWAGPEFYCQDCRASQVKQVRVCDTCGKEEETTWDKPFFYCAECRQRYRDSKFNR